MYYKDYLEIIGDAMDDVENDPYALMSGEDWNNYVADMATNPWG